MSKGMVKKLELLNKTVQSVLEEEKSELSSDIIENWMKKVDEEIQNSRCLKFHIYMMIFFKLL